MSHPILSKAFEASSQLILLLGESGCGKTYLIDQTKQAYQKVHMHHFSPNNLTNSTDWGNFENALFLKPVGKQDFKVIVVIDNADHLNKYIRERIEEWLQTRTNTKRKSTFNSCKHNSVILVSDTVFSKFVYALKQKYITDIATLSLPPHFVKVGFLKSLMPNLNTAQLDEIAHKCANYHMLNRMSESLNLADETNLPSSNQPSSQHSTQILSQAVLKAMNPTERSRFIMQHTRKMIVQQQHESQKQRKLKTAVQGNTDIPDKASNRNNIFDAIFTVQTESRFRRPFSLPSADTCSLDEFFDHDTHHMTEMLHFQVPMNLPNYIHHPHKKKPDCAECDLSRNQLDQMSLCLDFFSIRDICPLDQDEVRDAFADLAIAVLPKPTKASFSNETFKPTPSDRYTLSEKAKKDEKGEKGEEGKEMNSKRRHCYAAFCAKSLMTTMDWLETMWTSYNCDDGKKRDLLNWEVFPKDFLGWSESHRQKHNEHVIRLTCPPFEIIQLSPTPLVKSSATYDRKAKKKRVV